MGASHAPLRTAVPTVKTRKNVPMNSTMYFFMKCRMLDLR
jgi:hypothetical protein